MTLSAFKINSPSMINLSISEKLYSAEIPLKYPPSNSFGVLKIPNFVIIFSTLEISGILSIQFKNS